MCQQVMEVNFQFVSYHRIIPHSLKLSGMSSSLSAASCSHVSMCPKPEQPLTPVTLVEDNISMAAPLSCRSVQSVGFKINNSQRHLCLVEF